MPSLERNEKPYLKNRLGTKAITDKQKAVFEFIKSFIAVEGIPPTLGEIAHNFGFASATAARFHVVALKKKGYLTYKENGTRSIRCLV